MLFSLLLPVVLAISCTLAQQHPFIVKWKHGNHTTQYQPVRLSKRQANALALHGAVEYIVPDSRVRLNAVASTPKVIQAHPPSWGLARIAHRHWSPKQVSTNAYTYPPQAGRGVDVYVLDSGVDWTHPDLQGRVMSRVNFVPHEPNRDTAGHGTHVAGTIAGRVSGVSKFSRLHSYKVLDARGEGYASAVVHALLHLMHVRSQHAGPRRLCVVNLSLHTKRNRALDQVIDAAVQAGIVIVSSSANEHMDTCQLSPGGHPHVLAVGSTTPTDTVMASSGTGACVRIFAPGQDIVSIWPNRQMNVTMSGTSMSAPHVAGIAALFLSQRHYTHPTQVIQDILAAATENALALRDPRTPNRLAYNHLT